MHRKRSQVAVAGEDGRVQLNRNVVNGSPPMLGLLGGLPAGTPVAFEAAFGWGWLAGLVEDYRVRGAPGAPAAVQGDRLGETEERQGRCGDLAQLLRADLLPEAWVAPPEVRALRALLRHRIQPPRLPGPLTVKRRVSVRGAIMVGGQRIQVGLTHARKTAEVTVGADTYQIAVEDAITLTAPRTTSRDIKRHKASNYSQQRP